MLKIISCVIWLTCSQSNDKLACFDVHVNKYVTQNVKLDNLPKDLVNKCR